MFLLDRFRSERKKRNTVQLEWGAGLNKEFLQFLICMSGAKRKVLIIGRKGFFMGVLSQKMIC